MQNAPWPFESSQAEALFFENLRQKTDGFVAKNLNKRVSIPISRRLLPYNITPNQITAFHAVLAVIALCFVWGGSYGSILFGAILFWFSTVLDGCDGEVARAKNCCTAYGKYLDTIIDTLKSVAYVIVLSFALGRYWLSPVYTDLGYFMLVNSVYLMAILIVFSVCSPELQGSFKVIESSDKLSLARVPLLQAFVAKMKFAVKNDFVGFIFPVFALLNLNRILPGIAALALFAEAAVLTYLWINRKKTCKTGENP